LRFWRIENLTTFSGDQGVDFLIVKKIIIDGNFTLLGPKLGPFSDIANIYLGPAYYYLLSPSLIIFRLNPVGPAIFMAALAIITVYIIYLICRKFFSTNTAVIASTLYALNPELINQSRVALNPFTIPLFTSILIYSLLMIIKSSSKSFLWPVFIGFSAGILIQLHYLTIVLFPVIFYSLLISKKLKKLAYIVIAFLVAISPLIAFELRHNFFISNQIFKRITYGDDISRYPQIVFQLVEAIRLISSQLLISSLLLPILILASYLAFKKNSKIILILLSIVILNLIIASLYSAKIQLHYFAPSYISFFIITAYVMEKISSLSKNIFLKIIPVFILLLIVYSYSTNYNLNQDNGYTMPAGWNLSGIKKAVNVIGNNIDNDKTFNVAALLDGDTRAMPYRYLLEIQDKKPLGVEKYPEADVLYVISRDGPKQVKINPVWEISSFKP